MELLGQLLYEALDMLGLVGWVSDRHRPWIMQFLVVTLVLVAALIVVAILMVLTGHS